MYVPVASVLPASTQLCEGATCSLSRVASLTHLCGASERAVSKHQEHAASYVGRRRSSKREREKHRAAANRVSGGMTSFAMR